MTDCHTLASRPAGALHRVRLAALWASWALWCLVLPAAGQPAAAAALPAVVVWDFDDQTPPIGAQRMDYLRRALSENLTATLLQVAGLPVVERQRLKDLLAEQKLATGELADDDARLRLGRLVGAQRMVFGGYFVLGNEVQVHVRVVDTTTSRVVFSDETTADAAGVMQQLEPLNRRLARALGAGAAGGQRYSAQSWQAYDQALALADAGQLDEAIQALQRLLVADKTFAPAERQLVALLEKMARR